MRGKLLKELEDEASQLNRLGETGQAPSLLLGDFVGAQSSVLVVSRVQFLTGLRTPSLSNKFELKADS